MKITFRKLSKSLWFKNGPEKRLDHLDESLNLYESRAMMCGVLVVLSNAARNPQ